jgi:uncharacterized repeat protein (TIGR03803 family)
MKPIVQSVFSVTRRAFIILCLAGLPATSAFGQFQYERLYSFGPAEQTGAEPSGLIEGRDGVLYGFTETGGTNGGGTVFKLNKDGNGFAVLHSFGGGAGDGYSPTTLIEGSDGALYGTTGFGGITNTDNWLGFGTVFKLNKDGSGYAVIKTFSGSSEVAFAANPNSLINGNDGMLYGTTRGGLGTVFKLNKHGDIFIVLHAFTGLEGGDGFGPSALIQGRDGDLYGTTAHGGFTNVNNPAPYVSMGTVFKLNMDGNGGYAVLHRFSGTGADGGFPNTLLEGSDGKLYGTTPNARFRNMWLLAEGAIFKLNKDGSGFAVLSAGDSHQSVLEGNDGVLYGTTGDLVCGQDCWAVPGTVLRHNRDGGDRTVLRSFSTPDGYGIRVTGLLRGSDGSLYGTTGQDGEMSFGTILALRPQPILLPPVLSTNGVRVRFMSVPGSTNQLQRATALHESWLTLTNLITSTNGAAEFMDTAPPQPNALYRVVQLP